MVTFALDLLILCSKAKLSSILQANSHHTRQESKSNFGLVFETEYNHELNSYLWHQPSSSPAR